jgi:hypothetical protein
VVPRRSYGHPALARQPRRVGYQVHNVASWGRWLVPLMQWRLPTRMWRDLDQLLRMLSEQLGCTAYPLDRLHGSDAMIRDVRRAG